MKPNRPRCALARIIPRQPASKDELFDMAQEAWQEHQIFVGKPEQVIDSIERQRLINLGNELYGKRMD